MKTNYILTSLLPVDKVYIDNYKNMVDKGTNFLKDKNVNILSLARNVEKKLPSNIELLKDFFSKYSKNYHHFFFENDSTDETKSILKKYENSYENIHAICQNFNRPHFPSIKSQERITALAEYRNTIKDFSKKTHSDFTIVLDIDFDEINLSGILHSFGWFATEKSIGAIAGNSFQYQTGLCLKNPHIRNLWNYDSWAFRHNWWDDMQSHPPAPQNTIDPMIWFGFWIPPTGSPPITINSAFGGCCIYKTDIFLKGTYSAKDCEHVCFHYDLYSNKNLNFRLVLNPAQQMILTP